jgi:hypothetical protein
LSDSGEIERFTIGRGSLMIITTRLEHPDPSLPVLRIDLLRLCTTFHHNPTLADSQYTISSSVDVESFHIFVNAIHGVPFDITDKNMTDLLSLAASLDSLNYSPKSRPAAPASLLLGQQLRIVKTFIN